MAHMVGMICDTCKLCGPEIPNSNKKASLKPPKPGYCLGHPEGFLG